MDSPGENTKLNCKVVLLGNSGVGKTSLAVRWSTGVFSNLINPTIGANHQRKTIKIEKSEMDLYLWDTSGQEQFQSLTPLYVRSASAAFVTASITDLESFESLKIWMDLLNNSCEKVPPAILAVNKIDLEDSAVMTREEIEERFSDQFNSIFYVSAFSGENVENAFIQVAKLAYDFTKTVEKTSTQDITQPINTKKSCCN
ncbi:small GTP-binding protein [Histomonas meleagridis]|uniref:small GTP-binding protein n=1 Tax=Histomonas meleagridis TaxID=135588 RepID=UPI00355A3425|nr:small GTP-binding protein [Histomonas meleagridis]KAH0800155.1 small GTP-binding protein [Histomonas meleagridis]